MLTSLLLFSVIFIIYSIGVSHSVYGGDSGDIILASWFGGVAHPPGYPLNTMIGWIFTHLPYSASVAYKANLMAAFLMSATVSVLFLLLQKLFHDKILALSASLVLAFTQLFWLYAHIIEVFQLNLLLILISFYFLILWRSSKLKNKINFTYLNFSSLFLGLAVFHHHTLLLLLPAVLYLVIKTEKNIVRDKKRLLILFGFFTLGFTPYIFIPFAALRKTPINWDDPITISNFIRLITRADYGTFVAARQLVGADFMQRILQLVQFAIFFKSDFSIIGSSVVVIGAIYSFVKERVLFYFILIAFVLSGPFFLFYSSFPLRSDFFVGIWERFILISYLLAIFYFAFGLVFIQKLGVFIVSKFQNKNISKKNAALFISLITLIFPVYLIYENSVKTELSEMRLGDWLGEDVLASTEDGSVLFVFNDTTVFNTQYIYYTNENNRDIKLIMAGRLQHEEYRQQIASSYPELSYSKDYFDVRSKDSAYYINELVNSNIDNFPIYSSDELPVSGEYKWAPSGVAKELVRSQDFNIDQIIDRNERVIRNLNYKNFEEDLGYEHYLDGSTKQIYYRSLIFLSDTLIVNKKYEQAKNYLNKAVLLAPNSSGAYIRLGNIKVENDECEIAAEYFEKAFAIDSNNIRLAEILAGLYGECIGDKEKQLELRRKIDLLNESDSSLEGF